MCVLPSCVERINLELTLPDPIAIYLVSLCSEVDILLLRKADLLLKTFWPLFKDWLVSENAWSSFAAAFDHAYFV